MDIKKMLPLNQKNIRSILKNIEKKDIHYVLLGESTHGTKEYYIIRLIITIILIKEYNFRTIMFETEWSYGVILNMYIHSGNSLHGDSFKESELYINRMLNKIFVKYPGWMCNNEYIKHLLMFMKHWNSNHKKENDKVHFYGIDCQDIELAYKNVCDDVNMNCGIVKEIIKNYFKMKNSPNYWDIRDSFWFNIMETIKRNKNKTKFVLWAHNSHVGNLKANLNISNKLNIGFILKSIYKTYNIGFLTNSGNVKASNKWNGIGRKYRIPPAIKGSYEYEFHLISKKMNRKNIIYLTDNARVTGNPLFVRYIGVVYNTFNKNAHYFKTFLDKEFDAVIFIDETSFLTTQTNITNIKPGKILEYYLKYLISL